MRINTIKLGNIQLPEKEILSRLKYNIHKTVVDPDSMARIKGIMAKGFRACDPRGVWGISEIIEITDEGVIFESGIEIKSISIAKLLSGSHSAVFMAATAGPQIVDMASSAVTAGDGVAAIIFDAVGSETAEAAIEWLTGYIGNNIKKKGEKLTSMRFSPGYGDFNLEYQRLFYDLLQLNEMGVTLTERFILVPEKTVTAIAGISG